MYVHRLNKIKEHFYHSPFLKNNSVCALIMSF